MKYKCLCGAEHEISIPDAAVVERFNELVNGGKVRVECCGAWPKMRCSLVPTPRYRPYNTSDEFKLADFCGKRVLHKESKMTYNIDAIGLDVVKIYSFSAFSWQEMFDRFVWFDTGEPFGQKVSE